MVSLYICKFCKNHFVKGLDYLHLLTQLIINMIYIGQIDVVSSIVYGRKWIDIYICRWCRASKFGRETTNHFVINDRFASSTCDLSALHVDNVARWKVGLLRVGRNELPTFFA